MSAIVAELITTSRLDLVPLRAEHADEMAAVMADPDLYTFIGGSPPAAAALRARYELMIVGSFDPDVSWCNWVIQLRESGRLAGTVQATISAGDELVAEVAWVVGTRWQGQGIATEAARALVAWLGQQSVATVIAHIHPHHLASAAVASAVGLIPTDESQDGETRWRLTMAP
jgi:RimJ/RimL family protein N-acetyltransferase